MGRDRVRSRSRSRSPNPRSRSPSVKQRLPSCSLLVRNIPRDARPEDLRVPFERFGPVKDVYLPQDYYSREPRGFGFVEYLDAHDAADAKYNMDRKVIKGREITVIFAQESRKKPTEIRPRGRYSYGGGSYRRRPSRSPVYRNQSRLRSISPAPHHRSSRGDSHRLSGSTKGRSSSLARRSLSKSRSPSRGRHAGVTDYSRDRSVKRSPSMETNEYTKRNSMSRSPSGVRSHSRSASQGV